MSIKIDRYRYTDIHVCVFMSALVIVAKLEASQMSINGSLLTVLSIQFNSIQNNKKYQNKPIYSDKGTLFRLFCSVLSKS